MTIIFRTDSSQQIGSGHLMRCLTLADELRQLRADVKFVCREHPGHLIGFIESKGYPVVRLQKPGAEYVEAPEDVAHAVWLGVDWKQDAAETIRALEGSQPEWLIVDHYALDRRWEEKLRSNVRNIMVIDDLADRPHDCDFLLDQNLYQAMGTRYDNLVPKACQKLLGPKYALLRPEFAVVRKCLRQRSGEIERVLVFFGGVDPTNETEKALQALASVTNRPFNVDVVLGGGNLHKERIQNFCLSHAGFHCHYQVDNMAELMAAADLAIGAGGTATWERCAVGVPSLVTTVADNQRELAVAGAQNGLFFHLGRASNASTEKLLNVFKVFLCSPECLHSYSVNSLATVDAKGAQRVAVFICPPQISIRPARLEDCDAIYNWRNAEETRRYIFGGESIPLETHRSWYYQTLKNPDRILLVGEICNEPIGVLRYDLTGDEALISVYLVPGGQGYGTGSQLIRCGSVWIRQNLPQIKVLNAEIFPENVASLRAFEAAGYKQHHMIYKEVL